MDALGTLHNPAPVVAWNLDKRYLLDLAAAGVPVIPTRVCDDAAEVAAGARRGRRATGRWWSSRWCRRAAG